MFTRFEHLRATVSRNAIHPGKWLVYLFQCPGLGSLPLDLTCSIPGPAASSEPRSRLFFTTLVERTLITSARMFNEDDFWLDFASRELEDKVGVLAWPEGGPLKLNSEESFAYAWQEAQLH